MIEICQREVSAFAIHYLYRVPFRTLPIRQPLANRSHTTSSRLKFHRAPYRREGIATISRGCLYHPTWRMWIVAPFFDYLSLRWMWAYDVDTGRRRGSCELKL